jgi:hypothetical protein
VFTETVFSDRVQVGIKAGGEQSFSYSIDIAETKPLEEIWKCNHTTKEAIKKGFAKCF